MKILVTGGAGFIGSHLTDNLISNRHQVIIIDNLITGSKENLNPKAKLYKVDIRDHKKVEAIFKKEKPEVIYHLAAQMSVRKSVADPIYDAETNILATINLIKLAIEHKIKKFIFSSTGGAIYGDTDVRPTIEEQAEWPLSPYGIAKLTVDKYLYYAHKVFKLKYTSLRYGNVYGPRQNAHGEAGVIAIFLSKLLKGEQPQIFGSGKQTRDYVFVQDVVNANFLALKNINKVGIFNVGTSKETNVNQLFKEVTKQFENKCKKVHAPAKLGEQKTSCLSYNKIKKDFDWQPKIDFTTGIRKTYEWFLHHHK